MLLINILFSFSALKWSWYVKILLLSRNLFKSIFMLYAHCTLPIRWFLIRRTTNILEKGVVCYAQQPIMLSFSTMINLVYMTPFLSLPISNCTSHSIIIGTVGALRRPMTNNDQPFNPCPLIATASGNAHQPTRCPGPMVGRPFRIFSSSPWIGEHYQQHLPSQLSKQAVSIGSRLQLSRPSKAWSMKDLLYMTPV